MFKPLITLAATAAIALSSGAAMAEKCHYCDFSDEPIVVTPTPKSEDAPAAKLAGKRVHQPLLRLEPQLRINLGGHHGKQSHAPFKLGFLPRFGS